jgi:hypothetical protein
MQGSNLIFIVLPGVIPLVLGIGVALPFIADSYAGRSSGGRSAHGAARQPDDARAGPGTPAIPATRADTARPRTSCCVIAMALGEGHEL